MDATRQPVKRLDAVFLLASDHSRDLEPGLVGLVVSDPSGLGAGLDLA